MSKKIILYIGIITFTLFGLLFNSMLLKSNAQEAIKAPPPSNVDKAAIKSSKALWNLSRPAVDTNSAKIVLEDLRFSSPPEHLYLLDGVVINIESETEGRYLQLSLYISMSSEELAVEIESQKGKLIDSLIFIFSGKEFSDIMSISSKLKIKDIIITNFNNILTTGKVTDVYYNTFIVY